jgi:hypothetical protein
VARKPMTAINSAYDAVDGSSSGAGVCYRCEALVASRLLFRGVGLCQRSRLSISIHWVDAEGKVVPRRHLKRRYVLPFCQKLPSCQVGIEACGSSHHWSRELQALRRTVCLMPAYVNPYVKR